MGASLPCQHPHRLRFLGSIHPPAPCCSTQALSASLLAPLQPPIRCHQIRPWWCDSGHDAPHGPLGPALWSSEPDPQPVSSLRLLCAQRCSPGVTLMPPGNNPGVTLMPPGHVFPVPSPAWHLCSAFGPATVSGTQRPPGPFPGS